jgi:hypothetical protein
MITASQLAGLLAEPERLKIVGAIALGATEPEQILAATGLDARTVARAIGRLRASGLVSHGPDGLSVDTGAIKEAAREAADDPEPEDYGVADPATAAVLRAFIRDGRLQSIPAQRSKRLVVLEHIAMTFEPGIRFSEREVDTMLRAWHPDHAALRRYLVDEGFLAREAGEYWRSGGWVEV